jgi:Flp pilus assembly protein TadG
MRTDARHLPRRLARPRAGTARGRQGGQSLVEFALVFPVFALLLFAVVDIGRLVYVHNAIAEGAREGARWGSVNSRSYDAASRTQIGVHAADMLAAVPAPVVTVTCADGNGAARATCISNNFLTVRITTTVDLFTPLIGQILGTQTYTSTAQVVVNS